MSVIALGYLEWVHYISQQSCGASFIVLNIQALKTTCWGQKKAPFQMRQSQTPRTHHYISIKHQPVRPHLFWQPISQKTEQRLQNKTTCVSSAPAIICSFPFRDWNICLSSVLQQAFSKINNHYLSILLYVLRSFLPISLCDTNPFNEPRKCKISNYPAELEGATPHIFNTWQQHREKQHQK